MDGAMFAFKFGIFVEPGDDLVLNLRDINETVGRRLLADNDFCPRNLHVIGKELDTGIELRALTIDIDTLAGRNEHGACDLTTD